MFGSYDVTPGAAAASLLAQADPATMSTYDLIDAIKSWDRIASWAQANQAKMLAELAYRRPPTGPYDEGFEKSERVSRFVVDEISCALSLTHRGAENRLGVAMQLSDSLPETLEAWQRGDLDWRRVNLIVDRTLVLDDAARHRVEQTVLPRAENATTGQLRRIVDRAVIAADPAAADNRHDRERFDRDVSVRPANDGMSILQAYLCADEAAAAIRVLNAAAKETDGLRTTGQRRADALMTLITGAEPGCISTHAGAASVYLVVSADTIAGRTNVAAEMVGYGPIAPELARRLAADGTWQRILTDPATCDIVDIGRRRYRPPAALTEYIRARDQVCTFPTCAQPAIDCDVDHSTAFADGGETSAANLSVKCRRHHLLKHHAGWTTIQHADGTVTWISPTGHRYDNPPPRLLDEESPP
jgi:uncharacterized protein DUF222